MTFVYKKKIEQIHCNIETSDGLFVKFDELNGLITDEKIVAWIKYFDVELR